MAKVSMCITSALLCLSMSSPIEAVPFRSGLNTFRQGKIRGGGGMLRSTCETSCRKHSDFFGSRLSRIYAGQKASAGQFPWQASIEEFNRTGSNHWEHICGAVLIGSQFLLTAAHCLLKSEDAYRIILGTADRRKGMGRIYQMKKYVLNREPGTYDENDIALIVLSENVQCDNFVQPICIDGPPEIRAGSYCITSGWGRTEKNELTSQNLLYASVPVHSQAACSSIYNNQKYLTNYLRQSRNYRTQSFTSKMICAGTVDGGGYAGDICNGDSGGPLVCTHDGRQYLAGIVGWSGFACGVQPSIYTKVSSFRDWIRKEQDLLVPWL